MNLPPDTDSPWINVEDREPAIGEGVIVIFELNDEIRPSVAFNTPDGWVIDSLREGFDPEAVILCWMPIPPFFCTCGDCGCGKTDPDPTLN